jgi:hypothetical protein
VFASHLSDCGFCLHKTAELAELQMAFASDAPAVSVPEAMPSRISEVISGLFSRLFGQLDSGDAVFAHSEKKENEPAAEDSDESDVKDKDAE